MKPIKSLKRIQKAQRKSKRRVKRILKKVAAYMLKLHLEKIPKRLESKAATPLIFLPKLKSRMSGLAKHYVQDLDHINEEEEEDAYSESSKGKRGSCLSEKIIPSSMSNSHTNHQTRKELGDFLQENNEEEEIDKESVDGEGLTVLKGPGGDKGGSTGGFREDDEQENQEVEDKTPIRRASLGERLFGKKAAAAKEFAEDFLHKNQELDKELKKESTEEPEEQTKEIPSEVSRALVSDPKPQSQISSPAIVPDQKENPKSKGDQSVEIKVKKIEKDQRKEERIDEKIILEDNRSDLNKTKDLIVDVITIDDEPAESKASQIDQKSPPKSTQPKEEILGENKPNIIEETQPAHQLPISYPAPLKEAEKPPINSVNQPKSIIKKQKVPAPEIELIVTQKSKEGSRSRSKSKRRSRSNTPADFRAQVSQIRRAKKLLDLERKALKNLRRKAKAKKAAMKIQLERMKIETQRQQIIIEKQRIKMELEQREHRILLERQRQELIVQRKLFEQEMLRHQQMRVDHLRRMGSARQENQGLHSEDPLGWDHRSPSRPRSNTGSLTGRSNSKNKYRVGWKTTRDNLSRASSTRPRIESGDFYIGASELQASGGSSLRGGSPRKYYQQKRKRSRGLSYKREQSELNVEIMHSQAEPLFRSYYSVDPTPLELFGARTKDYGSKRTSSRERESQKRGNSSRARR